MPLFPSSLMHQVVIGDHPVELVRIRIKDIRRTWRGTKGEMLDLLRPILIPMSTPQNLELSNCPGSYLFQKSFQMTDAPEARLCVDPVLPCGICLDLLSIVRGATGVNNHVGQMERGHFGVLLNHSQSLVQASQIRWPTKSIIIEQQQDDLVLTPSI